MLSGDFICAWKNRPANYNSVFMEEIVPVRRTTIENDLV